MAEKRRGVLALVAGCGVLPVRGADDAAVLPARGADELLYGASKSGDEAASTGGKVATGAKRY